MADAKTEKQKVKEITDKLEEGLKELFESEKYKSYLSTMSKFHNYSVNNTLLIALQRPDASLVAGYQAWQKKFNRHVKKGEQGIRILAPAPYKIKEEREKIDPVTGEVMLNQDGMPQTEEIEIKIPAFRAVSVFDVSQTDGEPLPELEANVLLSTVEGYEDFIKAVTFVAPVPIEFEDIPGDSKGYFHTEKNRIAVQEGMAESQTLKTMLHETAHSVLHHKEVGGDLSVPPKDRNTKEVEAESIAYTVCQHFGIDTSDYSFGYIAGWSSGKDMKELKSSLDTIRRTASELITGIEAQLQELQRDREIMQAQEKESLLLVQNSDLSEYSLLSVRGMDAEEVAEALAAMNEDDKLSVAAYLESRGAWITEMANEETKEFAEYHLDVRYITDTGEIIDLKRVLENEQTPFEMREEHSEHESSKEAQLLHGEPEKKSDPAVYGHSLHYAVEHGEADEYWASNKRNRECIKAIEETIRENFDGMHLNGDIAEPLAEQYGSERIAFILANTLQQGSWDGRFSRDNKAWAAGFSIPENIVRGTDLNRELIVSSHPAVLNGFIDMFRKEVLEKELSAGQEQETSGHDVQKPETKQMQTEQSEPKPKEQGKAEQAETEQNEPEKTDKTPEVENMDDEDEIIDLGDEKDQVLAEMKKSLAGEKETELAFRIADRYISIQETEGGYDYSVMGADYKEIDGGVYDNPEVSIREALADIVEDLKENPFDNGARGNIREEDELIPIDYDELMERVEAADRIEPQAQGDVVQNFKAKTNELFHEISEMNPAEIEETVKCHVQAQLDEYGMDAQIVDAAVVGSRCRGLEDDGSDLDVVVELSTNEREDVLFDLFNGDGLYIGGVKVDINPITAQRTGTLETYLPQVEDYLEEAREAREKEPISIFHIRMNDEERWFKNTSGLDANGLCKAYAECDKPFMEMEKYGERIAAADYAGIEQGNRLDFSIEFNEETDQLTVFDGKNFEQKGLRVALFPEQAEPEVTLTVAECGEFHNLGEFYENIPTVEEAVTIWKQIPPERMNGIPAIGINLHTPGTERYEDVGIDILYGKRIDLEILDHIPEIKENPQAMEIIAELMAKLPEMEIDGNMSAEMEAKVWEKRMPDLTPAERLAVEIDRFAYDYDVYSYRNNVQSMTENVTEISEMLGQDDMIHMVGWLAEAIAEDADPEDIKRAKELLDKLAEYKPLAKIEEMEEQNYNMIDNVLNNGAGEKVQKEKIKKSKSVLRKGFP